MKRRSLLSMLAAAAADLGGTKADSDIQTAINAALGSGTVAVTGSIGGPFTITWQAYGPQSLLTISDSTLGTAVTITAAITTHGSSGGGGSGLASSILRSSIISAA
jgi:hypothetical protein